MLKLDRGGDGSSGAEDGDDGTFENVEGGVGVEWNAWRECRGWEKELVEGGGVGCGAEEVDMRARGEGKSREMTRGWADGKRVEERDCVRQ